MGWFLTNKKNGSGKRKTKSRGAKQNAWDPQRTLMGLKVLGVAALVVAAVIGWTTSERVLGRYAAAHRASPVRSDKVVLVDRPSWMDADLDARLRKAVADAASGVMPAVLADRKQTTSEARHTFDDLTKGLVSSDPLQSNGLRAAVMALEAEPWVESVTQVRRAPEGVVKVEATYRRPAAIIAGRHGYHLIDAQGVWLEGPIDRAVSAWSHLPLVTGVTADKPARYGKAWDGTDYLAALNLHKMLAREPYAEQITAYDVSHRDLMGRLWLVLYTNGPAVVWGLPPGEERSVEPEAPVKLAALRDWALAHRGRIDTQAHVVWVYTGTAQIDDRPTTISASRD